MTTVDAGNGVLESLERYDAQLGDPTREIYRRFYLAHPEAVEELAFDRPLEDRMMAGILALLADLADGTHTPAQSLYWISDHVSWDVDEAMIAGMFVAVRDTMRDGLGDRWTPEAEAAWDEVLAALLPAVHRAVDEAGGQVSSCPGEE